LHFHRFAAQVYRLQPEINPNRSQRISQKEGVSFGEHTATHATALMLSVIGHVFE